MPRKHNLETHIWDAQIGRPIRQPSEKKTTFHLEDDALTTLLGGNEPEGVTAMSWG